MNIKLKIVYVLFFLTQWGCKHSGLEVVITDVTTTQFPEEIVEEDINFHIVEDIPPQYKDFKGSIYYDISLRNRSDSTLIIRDFFSWQFDTLPDRKGNIYGLYRGDTIPFSYHASRIITLPPWNYENGRGTLLVADLYEAKYKAIYSTYREFSKDVVANTVLYFIADNGTKTVVRYDKPLKFEGNPNDMGNIIVNAKKGKIPRPK